MKTIHELKIWPEYFEQVRNGRMKFQLRRNNRDFKVGDELLLKEWIPGPSVDKQRGYTGRENLVRVDYIMEAEDIAFGSPFGSPVQAGFVIMSVSLV